MNLIPKAPMWVALYVALGLAAIVFLGLLIGVLSQVENWSRDFTTNTAATDEKSADPHLRPIDSALAPPELAKQVIVAAGKLPRWELADQSEADGVAKLHFIRTTGLWKFKDDIHVQIESTPGGSQLSAESRSRVGKGDLGQNPRNLRELLAAVRQAER
jgi:uncharacterized protein (DUF1499 family)